MTYLCSSRSEAKLRDLKRFMPAAVDHGKSHLDQQQLPIFPSCRFEILRGQHAMINQPWRNHIHREGLVQLQLVLQNWNFLSKCSKGVAQIKTMLRTRKVPLFTAPYQFRKSLKKIPFNYNNHEASQRLFINLSAHRQAQNSLHLECPTRNPHIGTT